MSHLPRNRIRPSKTQLPHIRIRCGGATYGVNTGLTIFDLNQARQALATAQNEGSALMIIDPGGTIIIHRGHEPHDLHVLQEAVGGYIEAVTLTQPCVSRTGPYLGYVNEEGALQGLEPNLLAAELFGVHIVGPLAVQVGFSLNHNGDIVPTPIQNGTQSC